MSFCWLDCGVVPVVVFAAAVVVVETTSVTGATVVVSWVVNDFGAGVVGVVDITFVVGVAIDVDEANCFGGLVVAVEEGDFSAPVV